MVGLHLVWKRAVGAFPLADDPVCRPASPMAFECRPASDTSHRRLQVADTHQVERRQAEDEHPPHTLCPPMAGLAQHSNRLDPSKGLIELPRNRCARRGLGEPSVAIPMFLA
jgi:hypothetical protein